MHRISENKAEKSLPLPSNIAEPETLPTSDQHYCS